MLIWLLVLVTAVTSFTWIVSPNTAISQTVPEHSSSGPPSADSTKGASPFSEQLFLSYRQAAFDALGKKESDNQQGENARLKNIEEAGKMFSAALTEAEKLHHPDRRLAASYRNLAEWYGFSSDAKNAEPHMRRAVAIDEQIYTLTGQDDDQQRNITKYNLTEDLRQLAIILLIQHKYDAASSVYRQLQSLDELGTIDPTKIPGLMRNKSDNPEYYSFGALVPKDMGRIADCYFVRNRYKEAKSLYAQAVELLSHSKDPLDSVFRLQYMRLLAASALFNGEYADAEKTNRDILMMMRTAPDHSLNIDDAYNLVDKTKVMGELGISLLLQGKHSQAEQILESGVQLREENRIFFPEVREALAIAYEYEGRFADAKKQFNEVRADFDRQIIKPEEVYRHALERISESFVQTNLTGEREKHVTENASVIEHVFTDYHCPSIPVFPPGPLPNWQYASITFDDAIFPRSLVLLASHLRSIH